MSTRPATARSAGCARDAPQAALARERSTGKGSFAATFRRGTATSPRLLRTTVFAVLLSTGVQGGHHTLATWVPTHPKTERGPSVVGTGGYLTFPSPGTFIGYLTGGHLPDRPAGRPRPTARSPSSTSTRTPGVRKRRVLASARTGPAPRPGPRRGTHRPT